VATGFNRNNGLLMDLVMTMLRPMSRSPEKGAETLVWLATSPDVANVSGYTSLTGAKAAEPEHRTRRPRAAVEIGERQCAVSGEAPKPAHDSPSKAGV